MTNYGIEDENGEAYTVGLQGEVVARRVAQRLANEQRKSVYLYEMGEDGEHDGESEEIEPETEPETVAYSYIEAGEQRSAEHACTTEQAIAAAVSHLDAIAHDGGYAYRAEETGLWYEVSADDMAELGAAVLAGRASQAYSLWCAGCGEEIDDPTELNAATITDNQIAALSREARAAGDNAMVLTCQRALANPEDYAGLTGDDAPESDVASSIARARQLCADAINRTRAQAEA